MKHMQRSYDEGPNKGRFKVIYQLDASNTKHQPSFGQSRIWTQTLHIQKFRIDIGNIRIPLQHQFFKLLLPMVIWKLCKQPKLAIALQIFQWQDCSSLIFGFVLQELSVSASELWLKSCPLWCFPTPRISKRFKRERKTLSTHTLKCIIQISLKNCMCLYICIYIYTCVCVYLNSYE